MANNNTHHLHREIESLRKQLMKEREESHYDVAVRLRAITAETEARILERCIVECMEEANAPTYTEEERIAILTATERLKEMRKERVKVREEQEEVRRKEVQSKLYEQMLNEKTQQYDQQLRQHMNEHLLKGLTATQVIMDEAAQVRWSNIANPKEWMK